VPRLDEDRRLATKNVTLAEIREAAREVAALHPAVEAVWLFGSYARGEQRPTSDVDFAVMTSQELARDYNHSADLEEAFERRLGVPVDVVLLHTDLTLPLIWEALSHSQLLFARDPQDAHAFASGLRALVRDEWPRLERRWERARKRLVEYDGASTL